MLRWILLLGLLAPAARSEDFIDLLSDPKSVEPTKPPSRRESLLSLSTEVGKGGRFGGGLFGAFGLDGEWQLLAGGNYTQLDAASEIFDGRFGANYQKSRHFELNLTGSGSIGPSTNRAYGALAEFQWWLNQLWGGKRATILRTNAGYTHYSLPIVLAVTRQVPIGSYYGTWGLLQEFFAGFFLEAAYSRYHYSVAPDLIRRGLANGRLFPDSSFGAVTQFPLSEWAVSAKWNATERFTFGAGAFTTRTFATGTTTWGVSPYTEIALSPSVIATIRGTFSRSEGSLSYLFSALLDLYW